MHTAISKDGTIIAYDKSGSGKPIILIGGALADRSDHTKLATLLSNRFTIYNYDRRGRGDSGDNKPYSVMREIEDIDAIIDDAGGSVYLYGISSGACLALEAASALGNRVRKLAIYEPPYDDALGAASKWKTYRAELDELVSADRRGDAVELHMKIVGASALAIIAMKLLPGWSAMKALAHTIPYDVAVVGDNRSVPVDRFSQIKANTLVMDGGDNLESMPFMRASADKLANTIAHSKRLIVEGQSHNVDHKVMAPLLIEFFDE